MAAKQHRKKCRTSGCKSVAQWRGVCRTCHRALEARVKGGVNTDEELVKAGAWDAERRRGRKPIGPDRVRKSLERKLAKV
jgi:hypothetical protein